MNVTGQEQGLICDQEQRGSHLFYVHGGGGVSGGSRPPPGGSPGRSAPGLLGAGEHKIKADETTSGNNSKSATATPKIERADGHRKKAPKMS